MRPRWQPPTPEAVLDDMVDLFAPLPPEEPGRRFRRLHDRIPTILLVEQRGAVTLVTLNRPQALNALNSEVLAELIAAFAAYDADDSQRCLVLTGSKRRSRPAPTSRRCRRRASPTCTRPNFFAGWERVTDDPQAVDRGGGGFALGGGCEVAMMADFIIAADNAKFGQPEIKLGVTPGMGGSQRLTQRGRQGQGDGDVPDRPDDGRRGSRARRAGGAGGAGRELLEEALKTAAEIAAMAPLAAIATKEMVNAAFELPLAQGIRFERRLFHGLFGTEDQKEGMAAFVEKRPGNWTGGDEVGASQWRGRKHGTRRIHRARQHGRRDGREPRQGGHEVARSTSASGAGQGRGARAAPGRRCAEAAVADAEAVVTMLPAGKHVAEVYRSAVFGKAPTSAILIDCSTIDVATARAVEEEAGAGYEMVDAPVSGGIAAAEGGTLTFMVGGTAEGFEKGAAVPRADGQGGDPRRRQRRGPGGEDLQQHAAGRDHGGDLRGVRAGAEARARPADLLRHLVQGVGPELVDDLLLPGPGRRPGDAGRPRL
jgi:enoyl-CoA hydratase